MKDMKISHLMLAAGICIALAACADEKKPKETVLPIYCATPEEIKQAITVSPMCEDPEPTPRPRPTPDPVPVPTTVQPDPTPVPTVTPDPDPVTTVTPDPTPVPTIVTPPPDPSPVPTTTPSPEPLPRSCNLNSRCIYTAKFTVAYCFGANDHLTSTVEATPVPDANATSLVKFQACCPTNAKKVVISPVVPGGYVDQSCNWHNFETVPINNPDSPENCQSVGVTY